MWKQNKAKLTPHPNDVWGPCYTKVHCLNILSAKKLNLHFYFWTPTTRSHGGQHWPLISRLTQEPIRVLCLMFDLHFIICMEELSQSQVICLIGLHRNTNLPPLWITCWRVSKLLWHNEGNFSHVWSFHQHLCTVSPTFQSQRKHLKGCFSCITDKKPGQRPKRLCGPSGVA